MRNLSTTGKLLQHDCLWGLLQDDCLWGKLKWAVLKWADFAFVKNSGLFDQDCQ